MSSTQVACKLLGPHPSLSMNILVVFSTLCYVCMYVGMLYTYSIASTVLILCFWFWLISFGQKHLTQIIYSSSRVVSTLYWVCCTLIDCIDFAMFSIWFELWKTHWIKSTHSEYDPTLQTLINSIGVWPSLFLLSCHFGFSADSLQCSGPLLSWTVTCSHLDVASAMIQLAQMWCWWMCTCHVCSSHHMCAHMFRLLQIKDQEAQCITCSLCYVTTWATPVPLMSTHDLLMSYSCPTHELLMPPPLRICNVMKFDLVQLALASSCVALISLAQDAQDIHQI